MSKEFEQIFLDKINKIEQKVSKIDEIEKKISTIDEIEKKISKIDEIEQKVSTIDEIDVKVDNVIKEVKDLKETLDVVKGSVIKLEHKVNTEFRALYEVYDLNYTLQKENVQRTNFLERKSDNFSIRIDNLEQVTQKHSKDLKKLIS